MFIICWRPLCWCVKLGYAFVHYFDFLFCHIQVFSDFLFWQIQVFSQSRRSKELRRFMNKRAGYDKIENLLNSFVHYLDFLFWQYVIFQLRLDWEKKTFYFVIFKPCHIQVFSQSRRSKELRRFMNKRAGYDKIENLWCFNFVYTNNEHHIDDVNK